jgi:hypothetical protein
MNTLLDRAMEPSSNREKLGPIVLRKNNLGHIEYEKDGDLIRLPSSFKKLTSLERNDETEILYLVDETLSSIQNLIGRKSISFNSMREMGKTNILVKFYNKGFEELGRTRYSGSRQYKSPTKSSINRWDRATHDHKIGDLRCYKDRVEIRLREKIKPVIDMLIPGSQVYAPLIPETYFCSLADEVIFALDELFLAQGIHPTKQARTNLFGLLMNISEKILELPEVQNLLGSDLSTHNVLNPNLIKLADMGYSDKTVKLLYIHNYYPGSFEELKELDDMPFDMLESVLKEAEL